MDIDLMIRPAARGGFAIFELKRDAGEDHALLACVSDDEGLLEWFAEQLGLASPARPGPTVDEVQAERPDIGRLAAEHTTAILQVVDIRKALAPFVELAVVRRDDDDQTIVDCTQGDGSEWAEVRLGQLRALLRAAGLFTDEMLPRPPTVADAKLAATAPLTEPGDEHIPDPPDNDGADASVDTDPLRGQRMDSADVGEEDESEEFSRDRQGVDPF